MLRKSLFLGMAAALIAASFGFMGCADDPPKSDAKSVIAFRVGAVEGVIDEDAKSIAVTLPAGRDVTALEPVAVVSKAAQIIDPATGAAIGEAGTAANEKKLPAHDFTVGKNYVVKAENGSTQTYRAEVTVLSATVLETLEVAVSKTFYDYNEAFDTGSLVLSGTYSDGSTRNIPVADATITGYDSEVEGTQNVIVTIGGVFATFQVTVLPEQSEQLIRATIALPNGAQEPDVYGIPEDGVVLSRYPADDESPSKALISVSASLWGSVKWFIDGELYSANNIITIDAGDNYTLGQPHAITFIGTKDGVEYSKTISFTVVVR